MITALRVTKKVSEKYFEAGFGTNAIQKYPETTQEKVNTTQQTTQEGISVKLFTNLAIQIQHHLKC